MAGSAAGSRALEIVAVRAWPVRVARLAELLPRTTKGAPTHSEYALLEVETAGGAVGLGEATTAPAWNGEDAVGSVDLVGRVLAPLLVGCRVDRWSEVARVLDGNVRRRPFLRAALEMACLDAHGRQVGEPVAALLGGVRRDAFATKVVLPAREPELVGRMADEVVRRGAAALKVKVGFDLGEDVQRVRMVQAAAAGRPVAVDANEGWSPDDPLALARALRPLGLVAVEQPFPRGAAAQTAALRRALPAEVVADESVWGEADLVAPATAAAFGEVSLYPGKVGGLRRCLRLAAQAHHLGFGVSFGSNLELGVGAAAIAHVLAATPSLSTTVASDLIGPLYFTTSLVRDASFVGFGGASLPAGPGLGVVLDEQAVAEHRLEAVA